MKRFTMSVVAAVLALGVLAGCGGAKTEAPKAEAPKTEAKAPEAPKKVTLTVGASTTPHADILKAVQPLAEKEGLEIKIVEFSDYVKPNIALAEKELDANYFQHVPYLTQFSADRKLELVNAGGVHLEPLGLYSIKVKALAELKDGAKIAIPDDPTNAGRALKLLADQQLITLKDGVGVKATAKDITANPKNLKIEELNAEILPRTLQDVDAAVINTNYYLEAQKNLKLEAAVLARESAKDNPFANIVAVRKGDETRPEIQKLMKLLQSPEVKKFIEEKFNGSILPAF